MLLVKEAAAVTAAIKRCHFVVKTEIELKNAMNIVRVAEGDYVASEGTYERIKEGNNQLDILSLENGLYTRQDQNAWAIHEFPTLEVFGASQLSEFTPSQAPKIPLWGHLYVEDYEFSDLGNVLLEDVSVHLVTGTPSKGTLLRTITENKVFLWIDPRSKLILKLIDQSPWQERTIQDASKLFLGSVSLLQPFEMRSTTEITFTRINDALIKLPVPNVTRSNDK